MKTTKRKAITEGKAQLRKTLGAKRLPYTAVEPSTKQCDCGETEAVHVSTFVSGNYESVIIGICQSCGT